MIWPCLNYRDAPAAIAFLTGVYVVTDDPAAVFERARSAGAHVVRELRDEPHGGQGFVVTDPEGNLWSIGSYRGEQR